MLCYIMWVRILDEVSSLMREDNKWNVVLGGMKVPPFPK